VTAPAQESSSEFEREPARLEPSGESETYGFAQEEAEESNGKSEDGEATGKASADGADKKHTKQKATNAGAEAAKQDAESDEELTEEVRFAIAEQRIAELEPLHQAALQRMNDVLTTEQAAKKAAATKQGLAAGLRGKQLQDAVFSVLELTEEQQQAIEKGRHDLHRVRLAIGKQVEGLLTKEQLDGLLRSHRH
jgi:hypothetical protein